MTTVTLDHLCKSYGPGGAAVRDISLTMDSGAITAVLGPSGCGKTTTLKMVAGLLAPTSGDIYFDDHSVLAIPAEKRGAVMVFQDQLLFPYMTVEQNIGFGLKMRGVKRKTIREQVQEMLTLIQLPGVGRKYPKQLSGGQQQRVALAQALVIGPKVLLLDEPLSSLDAHLRDEMRQLIRQIQRQFEITTAIVTHDQQEAVLLADNIALMFDGLLHQCGSPADFYNRPASEQVSRFFGGTNFIPATWDGDTTIETDVGTFWLAPETKPWVEPGAAILTIRPEHIQLSRGNDKPNTTFGYVRDCIYAGPYTRYIVQLGDHNIEATDSLNASRHCIGDKVSVHFPPEHIWLLPGSRE